MSKWPERVNVPPEVLYFNVWEVYNLGYYTAVQKYLIITSLYPYENICFYGRRRSPDKSIKWSKFGAS